MEETNMNSSNPISESKEFKPVVKTHTTFPVPQFDWEDSKWATTRNLSVEDIASIWQGSPYKVRTFSDKKLALNSLVMLKKEAFEKIITVLRDLHGGEPVIKANLEAIFTPIKVIEK